MKFNHAAILRRLRLEYCLIGVGACLLAALAPLSFLLVLVILATGVVFAVWPLRSRTAILRATIIAIIGVVYCIFRFSVFYQAQQAPPRIELVQVCVQELERASSERLVFKATGLTARSQTYRLVWYAPYEAITPGSCWRFLAKLKPPRGTLNYVGFDYERWLFAQRITALGTVRASSYTRRLGYSQVALIATARMQQQHWLQQELGHHRSLGLLSALSVGLRGDLSPADWQVLRRTGTAHLVAISGLHIGLAALFGFSVGRYTPIFIRPHTNLLLRGAAGSVIAACCYAALAGFAIPTVRALLMLLLWVWLRYRQIHLASYHVLILAMAIMLAVNPFQIVDSGFALSFLAVAVFTLGLSKHRLTSPKARLFQAVRIQWLLMITLLPLTIGVAGGISLAALPVNLIFIPIFSFVLVPLVLLALVASVFSKTLALSIWTFAAQLLDKIWLVLESVAHWEYSFVPIATITSGWNVLFLLPGLMLMLPRGIPGRWIALLAVLPLVLPLNRFSQASQFRISVMDVGQALAVVIETANGITLYDTGNRWANGNHGEQLLAPTVRARGYTQVNNVIVSHADKDHAGGLAGVDQSLAIGRLWASEDLQSGVASQPCWQGQSWQEGPVSFRFLHPEYAGQFQGNDQSCVLLITSECGSVLLTGDLSAPLERRLLAHAPAQVDLVIGLHHGSGSSSDPQFVARLGARYVVFSSGFANQWSMPREQVRLRWQQAATETLNTAEHGQLEFDCTVNGGLRKGLTARQIRAAPWRWNKP